MNNYELLQFFAQREKITLSTISKSIVGQGTLHQRLKTNSVTLKTQAKVEDWIFTNFPCPRVIHELEPAIGGDLEAAMQEIVVDLPSMLFFSPCDPPVSEVEKRKLFYIPRKKSREWQYTPYRIWTPSVSPRAKRDIEKFMPGCGYWMYSWEGQTLIVYSYQWPKIDAELDADAAEFYEQPPRPVGAKDEEFKPVF